MNRLKDKVAIITGGAKGIGKATAIKFVAEGALVAIWDIDEKAGKETVEQLGKNARFYPVNTTNSKQVAATTQQVIDDFGGLDILINNAGITKDASMKKMSDDQWQQVIDVNLTGVFNCAKAAYPFMALNGSGTIINAASVVALYGNFGQSNYVATKAGVIGLTKVWAREFGRKGITVNAVAPGFVDTEMMRKVPPEILDKMLAKTPLGRFGKAEEVANAYVFLASEEASYITGTTISVDGGMVA